jgi:hypothetical protein
VDSSDASPATKAEIDESLSREEVKLDDRLKKVEDSATVQDATNAAKETIDGAAEGGAAADGAAAEGDDEAKKAVEAALAAAKAHEKECHEPPVYVGKNNIPAEETRSVLYVSDPEENAAKIAAVDTPPELVIDQPTLDMADDSIEKSGNEINDIHTTVKELSEAPLVPEKGEAIMAKLKVSEDDESASS